MIVEIWHESFFKKMSFKMAVDRRSKKIRIL